MTPARLVLVALLVACSHPAPPQPARPIGSATAGPARSTAFAVPEVDDAADQLTGGPHRLVAYVPGGFVVMPKMLWELAPGPVDPEAPRPGAAAPIPYPTAAPQPATALDLAGDTGLPIVLLVDRDVPLAKLAPLRDALANRRLGFVVRTRSRYGVLVPEPIPAGDDVDQKVQLSVEIAADGHATLTLSRIHESHTVERAQLEAALHEQKVCAFFADRTDISLALPDTATVGDLVELLVLARRVGFMSPAWVARDRLPR